MENHLPVSLAVPGPASAGEKVRHEARLLTVEQAGKYLGLSRAAVFHRVARRELPFVRVGKRAIRLDREALDRWIEKKTVRPLRTPALEPAAPECETVPDGSRQTPA